MKPEISVLIVTRNRRNFLDRCLMCIYSTSSLKERKIYVWDNASEDDTSAYLSTLKHWHDIVVMRSNVNIGTRARQEMLNTIDSPYILTMDDDAWILTPEWASAMIECFKGDPKLGALMFGRTTDERNSFGVTCQGVEYKNLSRPRFKSENLIGAFKSTIEPPDEKHRKLMKKIGNHWILPENNEISIGFGGWCTIWRSAIVKKNQWKGKDGTMTDMATEWHELIKKQDYYSALTIEFLAYHGCGPWWHLFDYGELSWEDKVRESPIIYTRDSKEQQKWYDDCKKWSGWNSGIPTKQI